MFSAIVMCWRRGAGRQLNRKVLLHRWAASRAKQVILRHASATDKQDVSGANVRARALTHKRRDGPWPIGGMTVRAGAMDPEMGRKRARGLSDSARTAPHATDA